MLLCEMYTTVKGMISNYISMIKTFDIFPMEVEYITPSGFSTYDYSNDGKLCDATNVKQFVKKIKCMY